MKVMLLHGQNHRQSSWHMTHLLLEQLPVEALHKSYLPKDMPRFRCGCCRYVELGEDSYPHTAYMAPIMKAMKEVDLLIFTTPTYYLRTSGPMKASLDYRSLSLVVHRPLPSMYHKQAVILVSDVGGGMKKAVKDIHTSLIGRGISHIGNYDFRPIATTWETVPESIERRLATGLAKLVSRIKRRQHHKRISWKQKLLFHAMRRVRKHGMGVGELDYQCWKEWGWLGHGRPWTDDEQNMCIYFRCTTCACLLLYAV